MDRFPTRSLRWPLAIAALISAASLAAGAAWAQADTSGSAWRILEIDGAAAAPVAELVFREGQLFGTVGCNRFRGPVERAEDGRLEAGLMAATLMACPDPTIDAQERRLLDLLGAGPAVAYDPLSDRLTLSDAEGRPVVLLERLAP